MTNMFRICGALLFGTAFLLHFDLSILEFTLMNIGSYLLSVD